MTAVMDGLLHRLHGGNLRDDHAADDGDWLMLFSKIFLAIVGVLYLGLALWCSFSPAQTSEKVGFELKPGTGQSEFLTVYGGLEFGLALVFLLPLVRSEWLFTSMLACVLIHGSLVVFRTISFTLFSNIAPMTFKLAAGEWVIFLIGLACLYLTRSNPQS
jgi:hypothetical protein